MLKLWGSNFEIQINFQFQSQSQSKSFRLQKLSILQRRRKRTNEIDQQSVQNMCLLVSHGTSQVSAQPSSNTLRQLIYLLRANHGFGKSIEDFYNLENNNLRTVLTQDYSTS